MSNPQRIWWCEEHNHEGVVPEHFDYADECWWVVWSDEVDGDYNLCRIVEKAVVPIRRIVAGPEAGLPVDMALRE